MRSVILIAAVAVGIGVVWLAFKVMKKLLKFFLLIAVALILGAVIYFKFMAGAGG